MEDGSGVSGIRVGYYTPGGDDIPLQETTLPVSIPIITTDGIKMNVTLDKYQEMLGRVLKEKKPEMFKRWSNLVDNAILNNPTEDVSLLSTCTTRKEEFALLFRQSALN